MKRIFAAMCALALLMAGCTPALAAEPPKASPSAEPERSCYYPIRVDEYTAGPLDELRIDKVYQLSLGDDPSLIPTEDFTRNGRLYYLLDMVRKDEVGVDTQAHTETVTLASDTDKMVDALYDKAGDYCEAITQAIGAFHTGEYPTNDLMRYFKVPGNPRMEGAVREKVRSAHVGVAAVGDTLYAGLRLDLAADLTPDVMAVFTEQIGSQYRDGWGAQFKILDIPAGEEGVAVRFWQDSIEFCTELASTRFQRQPGIVLDQDTFWSLIDQAKEHPGGPNEWLMEQLMDLGPEQAKKFDTMARVYMDLAYQYGLWTAASVMERGFCSDNGFIDFRSWLVGQGKAVYMAALADPDSLADGPDYQDRRFEALPHMGDHAYEELTGRDSFEDFDPAGYDALKAELKQGILYGEGINYPYNQADIPAYVPRLCARYLTPEQVRELAQTRGCTWNLTSAEVRLARQGPKNSRVTKTNRCMSTPTGSTTWLANSMGGGSGVSGRKVSLDGEVHISTGSWRLLFLHKKAEREGGAKGHER